MDSLAQRFLSSSSTSRSSGGEWTRKLYLYPDVHNLTKDIREHVITNSELLRFGRNKTTKEEKLEKLLGEDEEIELVRVYSNPLNSAQMTKVALHHAFVLFKIRQKTKPETWWSIEKNTKSITIQISKNGREIVRDCYKRERRPVGPTTPNTRDRDLPANENATVYNLIQHIYDGNYLNDPYNLKNSNCQHFADRIFEFLAIPLADRCRRMLTRSVFILIITCSVLLVFYALLQILSTMWTRFQEPDEL
ncbi:hypothetical protein DAPPUDRAFT_344096 [Daphnia pulex]|uniref:PPPDE domain-containing protein n=1 Tax=Daphnia pulex TaxID=6669 RepID=E9I6J9_DAPPU|nr:hypothetical protein DAPPUDRAFT_344096 [Daphnia pulex]|eukprot:EFX60381.1 hypothetical protein DAPPUDRAFT_344096 [Daphnia pulex]